MEISITVTKSCNLKCKYCYQGKHESIEQIPYTSIGQLVSLISKKLNQNNDSSLHIVFIGGEPLLAYEKIIYIIEMMERGLSNTKVKYYITTNGTVMNAKIINLLSQRKFEVSVSIDGNKQIHDRNRVDAHGNGTYEEVISNIKKMQKNDIDMIARMTITPEGASTFYEDVITLHKQNVIKINPVCDFTCKWNNSQIEDLKISYKKLADWYIKMSGKVFLSCFDGRFYSLLTRKQFYCNAGTGPHYVVSTSGKIYPCNYVTDNYEFLIGDLKKIKSPDEVKIVYQKYIVDNDIKCKYCNANDFCYGKKCCFINWKTSGYLNITPDILCQHEKFIFELLQEILISMAKTNPKEINELVRYIEKNKLGNKTYEDLKGILCNMI